MQTESEVRRKRGIIHFNVSGNDFRSIMWELELFDCLT